MPTSARDGFGRPPVVAGDHRNLQAERVERRNGLRGRRLDRIRDGDDRRELAIDRRIERALAFLAEPCRNIRETRACSRPSFVMKRSAPTVDLPPVDDGRDAEACRRLKCLRAFQREPAQLGGADDGLRRSDARSALRRMPRGAGPRFSTNPSATTKSVSSGRPLVSVPVLSSATTPTSFRLCRASPWRNSTPSSAARPVPTMIEVGVASPMAHGHAMIEHRDRIHEREGQSRLRTEDQPHAAKVSAATAITAGTNQAGHLVDEA